MATWTNIQTSRLEPGKPIRSIDGLALRDNPIAIAEGASGAPRVQTNGIANSAVTTAKINNNAVTTGKIANNAVTSAKLRESNAERDWVLGRTSKATAGAVGTYAMVIQEKPVGAYGWNSTTSGSNLQRSNAVNLNGTASSTRLSGTWRIMGVNTTNNAAVVALRIS